MPYFNGNPVELTAIPNPGYEFAYWDTNEVLNNIDTSSSIFLNITASTLFKAVFNYTGEFGKIAISELNYHSDSTRNAGDWIELHNYGNAALNLAGWSFTDSTVGNQYVFPLGAVLPPDGYLVLTSDTALFRSQFPAVDAYGPIGFSFSNAGESLTLLDENKLVVQTMRYNDASPWPAAADGYGKTLERLNDTLNPALASSWFAGCIGGSPGKAFMPCTEQLIFSEINYLSATNADAGDWVELLNTAASPLDISGWEFKDSDDNNAFKFPSNTILPALGRLVLAADTALFAARFPTVTNKTGPTGFGLSNTGEALRLFDATGRLYQSMVYDQAAPWPQGANGNGYTLELVNETRNLCDGNNWQDGCPEGSPGKALELPCFTSGVEGLNDLSSGFILFPNPSSGIFTVQLLSPAAQVVAEVYNTLGERIYANTGLYGGDGIQIDLTGAATGMYLMRIWVNGQAMDKVFMLVD